MSYQVIARKYRPQTFEEVVGQQAVTTTLVNAIKSGRIAHAFLFSGVRGVGKTTMARILAKALNCRKEITVEPCGECVSCTEIAQSNSVDVQEIDAASNTGVDNIRELRESVMYGTARDRFKIFIIDEVHMLSNAAFNALLKTLEEPPSHVKFILATTEKHKIPVTITSRCQHFDFRPIAFQEIHQRLQEVCKAEGITISDAALRAIVEEGQGSMRDAQSALDQILSFGGKEVQDEQVRALLGLADENLVFGVVEAVLGRDRQALIEQMQQLTESGAEAGHFCRELIRHLRNLMVCAVAGWDERLLHLPDTQKEQVEQQSQRFSRLELMRFYDLLNRTQSEIKWHSHPYIHLEISLMKLVELAELPAIEEVIGQLKGESPSPASREAAPQKAIRKSEAPAAAKPVPKAQAAPAEPLSDVSDLSDLSDSSDPSEQPEPSDEGPPWYDEMPPWEGPEPDEPPAAQAAPASSKGSEASKGGSLFDELPEGEGKPQADAPDGFASKLLALVRKEAAPLHPFLLEAREISLQDGVLSIVFSSSGFHKTLLEKRDNQEALRRLCAKMTGSEPSIRLLVDEQGAPEPQSKQPKPEDNPKVKAFTERFPGKLMVMEHNPED